jgi:hypothetical protein
MHVARRVSTPAVGICHSVLENFVRPGRPTFPGRGTYRVIFEQIERCDHERESPAVDDWDAAQDEVVGLDGQQIEIE